MDKAEQRKQAFQWLQQQKEIVVDTTKIPSTFSIWLERREGGDWMDAAEYALRGLNFMANGKPK